MKSKVLDSKQLADIQDEVTTISGELDYLDSDEDSITISEKGERLQELQGILEDSLANHYIEERKTKIGIKRIK